jgi:four helix bundle protein
MQNPENLRVSAVALDLADAVYEFTGGFPRDERFGLCVQMQRAAVSIGSNIYEGCGRGSNKGLVAFLYIALGSASELEFQLKLALRRGFGEAANAKTVGQLLTRVKRMLALLIKHLSA